MRKLLLSAVALTGPNGFGKTTLMSLIGLLLIPPQEIVLSQSPLDSSLCNSFPGRVTGVGEWGNAVAVEADIGVRVTAVITPVSYRYLGLAIGSPVTVSFKAAGAKVY